MASSASCPLCLSSELWRYGKHPQTGKQKFMCKQCYHQFVPGQPTRGSSSKYGLCPQCGCPLELRKRNKTSLQLRCSSRRLGKPRCRFSQSLSLISPNLLKSAASSEHFFRLPKFLRFNPAVVLSAFKLFYKFNLSTREIKTHISQEFQLSVSHVSIYFWTVRFAYFFSLLFNNRSSPGAASKTWLFDDTVIKINGTTYRLFVVLCAESRLLLAWYLSPTRDTQAARTALKLACQFTKATPQRVVSDHARYIKLAIEELFSSSVEHITCSLFDRGSFSNNRIERFFSTPKGFLSRRRSFKSLLPALAHLTILLAYYNFFRPHLSLGSQTPAQFARLPINRSLRRFFL